MIYSILNFVIPVKKYWREKRKKNWILARTNMSSFPYAIICRKNGAWKFILPDNENACVDRSNNVLEDPRGRSSRVQQRFERSWNRSVTLPSFRSNLLFRPSSIHLGTRILERNISSDTWSGDAVDRETANRFDKKGRGREDHVKILLHAGLESQRGNLVF